MRYVQEIQQIEDKLLQSPLAPKNKLLSEKQAFGSSGQASNFSLKRDTTLGYFSVPQPYELGPVCERMVKDPEDRREKRKMQKQLEDGAKSDRKKNSPSPHKMSKFDSLKLSS